MALFPDNLLGNMFLDMAADRACTTFWDASPPDSPCYTTSVSDGSLPDLEYTETAEFLPVTAAAAAAVADFHKLDVVLDKALGVMASPTVATGAAHVMWGSATEDLFLSSSVAWVPGEPTLEDEAALNEFNLGTFGLTDELVAQEAETVPPPAPKTAKRKASALEAEAAQEEAAVAARPAKKAKPAAPASPAATLPTRDDPEAKRHTHNVLERKRRNDLKTSYQDLRLQLPSLADNDRAPTGQILLHAVSFITDLKNDEARLLSDLALARAENERLRGLRA